MNRRRSPLRTLGLALALTVAALAPIGDEAAGQAPRRVSLSTTLGEIVLELDTVRAPISSAHFLAHVRAGRYDGTVFHRVLPGFMIQSGGFRTGLHPIEALGRIRNEADNGLTNRRGTVAMARTSDPHSASSQFFINTVDNPHLDHRTRTARGWGYAVFGRVVGGMDVVDRIDALETTRVGPYSDVPVTPVVVERAQIIE